MGTTDPLLMMAIEEEVESNAPPQPEALGLLRQLRRFGTLPNPGGLFQQPYIFMLELHACIDAEIEVGERVVQTSWLNKWHKGDPLD